jgi:glutaredoxin
MSCRLVVYSKPGCHLCEDTLRLLQVLHHEFDLTIEEIDITTDRELFKNYFEKIPVLVIDGHDTFAAPIPLDEVRATLLKKM